MSLTNQLQKYFKHTAYIPGKVFFRRKHVTITKGSAYEVEAAVRDLAKANVRLVRNARQIFAECSCAYFTTYGPCKHLWATLLMAERHAYLQGDGETGALELVKWKFPIVQVLTKAALATPPGKPVKAKPVKPAPAPKAPPKPPDDRWKKQLADLLKPDGPAVSLREQWPAGRQLLYVIDVALTQQGKGLYLELYYRDRKRDGEWGVPKTYGLPRALLSQLRDADDQFVLSVLLGASTSYGYNDYSYGYASSYGGGQMQTRYRLLETQPRLVLPVICRTGRSFLRMRPPAHAQQNDTANWLPLTYDAGEPWQFRVVVEAAENGYAVCGRLRRGDEQMALTDPVLFTDAGLFFTRERAVPYDDGGAFPWLALLRKHGALEVPESYRAEFLGELLNKPVLPPLELPPELQYETAQLAPRPQLLIKPPDKSAWRHEDKLRGVLSFAYGDAVISATAEGRGVYDASTRTFCLRDAEAEAEAAVRLTEVGWQLQPPDYYNKQPRWLLAQSKLPRVVRLLLADHWHVEAEGKVYRQPGEFKLEVSSGIDWFDLHGTVEFGGVKATLPALLAALKRGETVVALGDGTFGLLPEEWLQKYGLLAGLGEAQGDALRFKKTQVGVLDALLAAQPEASFDEAFTHAREELKRFQGIEAAAQPAGFAGELRGYQKEGLGWLGFLQRFGFGGCLADDMGVGKTPQVLALLETRRLLRQGDGAAGRAGDGATGRRDDGANGAKAGGRKKKESPAPPVPPSPALPVPPSLVVVPKSLVFNWQQEAARFTPQLRVLDHTGQLRQKGQTEHFDDYDVVLTTYGTLRNDVVDFKDTQFDYVVLDEAQAIKNAESVSAKAVRLLNGRHRVAMSGTPIENHLGELWSLFEFLNPGMLGAASVFKLTGAGARNPDEETRRLLAQALRPFILRRTKEQVAKELPAKLEQTLYCELEPAQRKLYNELRDHYRTNLLERIARDGLAKAKIQVLEALLRLRQAAIHPGLIDAKRAQDDSAKLDLLLTQLDEVLEGEHKALVFSQFTSMLAIVRARLDKAGIVYEYLDGRTRDRQARVERFQNDPHCKLFLISLKAGGLGLNLTAAEYVFLLDPWWNPAVEMQAIDRAHRIGQERQVFAYRLIARDTVEEKVLQLQNTKRELADAIISADNSLIRSLGREDLELLLS